MTEKLLTYRAKITEMSPELDSKNSLLDARISEISLIQDEL